jgi:hypothetical protein
VHPSGGGLFLDAFDPIDSNQAIAFSHQSQAFRDRLRGMAQTIEKGALGGGEHFLTGFALKAGNAFSGLPELRQVACIDFAIIRTLLVPTEGDYPQEGTEILTNDHHFTQEGLHILIQK